MLYKSGEMEEKAALQTAARMCAAARTAPKGIGVDTIHTLVLTGEDKEKLARKMEEIGTREMGDKMPTWYGRDAANVRKAQVVVLIGAEKKYRGLHYCGFCGFPNCKSNREAGGSCAFMYTDLGIAVSSAAATAADDRVDTRIMYSIGKAAGEMDYGSGCVWLGIPVSISGKSVFFDRGITHD